MPRWKGRKRPRNNNKQYHPYKNKFEFDLASVLTGYSYETQKIEYVIQAKYNPDFICNKNDWLFLEAKGYFISGAQEARKYLWVKKCNPKIELVFLFDNPTKKAYSSCKIRKDGSMLTMGEWAAKNGFAFVSHNKIPRILSDGLVDRAWVEDLKDRQYKYYFNKGRKR